MQPMNPTLLACAVVILLATIRLSAKTDGWMDLFDGSSLSGWKASEHSGTFRAADGAIVARGERSHLFYVGPVNNADFKNFEFSAEVLTTPGTNSGIYFHTRYQDHGFPSRGYQVQINNTNPYPSKTGSLYGVQDLKTSPVTDNEWFTLSVRVEGRQIISKVNNVVVCDYTEPDNPERKDEVKGSVVSRGTFALQGHDPVSEVRFRKIRVRVLE